MKFSTLFRKLGKQPIRITQNNDVVAVLERDYLESLLQEKKSSYEIPLELKYGNGQQAIWFVRKGNKETRRN